MSAGPLVIVGDALLDRDIDGHAGRLCPDAPAPVIEGPAARERPGGAALAALLAARAADPGAGVTLITPLGADQASQALRAHLPGSVSVIAVPLRGALQEKTRVMADGRTLLRMDTQRPVPGRAGAEAVAAIAGAGALLVSDYGHGITTDRELRDALTARSRQVPLVWDPHPRGADPVPGTWLVTPNQSEALAASREPGGADAHRDAFRGDAFRDAAAAAESLLGRWPARAVAVTLGPRGALLARRSSPPLAVPAPAAGAGDPCGAGDMFAAAAAAALHRGALLPEAVTWAVGAASRYIAAGGVSALGTAGAAAAGGPRPNRAACALSDAGPGTAGPGTASGRLRGHGGVLVAAGGCFDVLHAGHVSMLRAARALGDALVVCVNSDASVRRLKGAGRPLNPVADRLAVLGALDCVDDVAVFDEDTPERLLGLLRPDIWVKGGDYDGRELPEAAVLRRWGGLTVTVPYLDGRSTTRIAAAAARLA